MEFIDLSPQQKFTTIQKNLDDLGFMTHINRIITGKRYEVIVNGAIVKQYKTRRSARLFIIKLYNKHERNDQKSSN